MLLMPQMLLEGEAVHFQSSLPNKGVHGKCEAKNLV